MIERLHKLVAVREARQRALEIELARCRSQLASVDEELSAIDRELRQIERQKAVWEGEWQEWLHQDGVLRHGQDYNLAHVALSAWERDARQVREEIEIRREYAAEQESAARQLALKAERRLSLLRTRLQEVRRRMRRQHTAMVDSRLNDEHAARAWLRRGATG